MATRLQNLDYASDSDVWAVIEVDKLTAGVEGVNNVSGTNAPGDYSVTVVRAPDGTLLSAPGYGIDLYDWFVEYPINSAGEYVDCEIRFAIGQKDVTNLVVSGGYTRNMFPRHDRVYGGRKAHVPYARSMREAWNEMQKGRVINNLPFQILGLKIPAQQALQVTFKSTKGWGVNGTAVRPLRLYLLADMWTDNELGRFQSAYNGSFSVRRHPTGTVSGTHVLPGVLGSKTMAMLPNGTLQGGGPKVSRYLTYATNNNPITTSSEYVYSDLQAVGGQQNNVIDARHDLGFPYKDTASAFIPYELGVNFAESLLGVGSDPVIQIGWWQSATRTLVPDMHKNGLRISGQRNPFQYGATAPQVDAQNQMFALASARQLVNLLIQGDNWAPAVSAMGLSSGFAANSIYMALGGISVEN